MNKDYNELLNNLNSIPDKWDENTVSILIGNTKSEEDIENIARNIPSKYFSEEVSLRLLLKNVKILEYLPDDLMTEEFSKIITAVEPNALKYIPDNLKTKEMCLASIKCNPYNVRFTPARYLTLDILVRVLKKNIRLDKFIPKDVKDSKYWDEYFAIDLKFKGIPDKFKTREFYNKAFNVFKFCFREIPKEFITQEMCNEAYEHDSYLFKYIPREFITEDILMKAFERNRISDISIDIIPIHLYEYAACKNLEFLYEFPEEHITQEMCIKAWDEAMNRSDTNVYHIDSIPEEYITEKMCFDLFKYLEEESYADERIVEYIPDRIRHANKRIDELCRFYCY